MRAENTCTSSRDHGTCAESCSAKQISVLFTSRRSRATGSQIQPGGGAGTEAQFAHLFFVVAETKKTSEWVAGLPDEKNIWQTKKTSGRQKFHLPDEKNVWQTKKTSGRRKKRLDDVEETAFTPQTYEKHRFGTQKVTKHAKKTSDEKNV